MPCGYLPRFLSLALLTLCCALAACSPRQLIVQGMGDALASQGQAQEEDLELAREASAFYLKLSESLLREAPGNLKLAESVAAGFTQYAYAFVAFEAERLATQDTRRAHQLDQRARRLYLRAHRHAMAALEQAQPGFARALAQPDPKRWPRLTESQVGVAYWAAASWGAYISLSKDDPEGVADLPLAVRLAELAWQVAPNYGDGALASLMGSFEAARAGGSRQQAARYFDQAIVASAGQNAAPYVAKAETLALADGDRSAFETLLQQALAASANRSDLSNQVMQQRARWLLETADDLF